MTITLHKLCLLCGTAMIAGGSNSSLAFAQTPANPTGTPEAAANNVEEIVVTARKREERLTDVPVAVTAYQKADLERFAYSDLVQVAAQTPQLIVNQEAGAGGGSISLRGVSTGLAGTDFDQAVSLNVDGVVISRIATLQQGFFDVEQIEILKGPQALFFGKNSPGGIISFQTADPGNKLEAKVRGSYEFNSRAYVGEGVLSGPLTSDIGARLAVQVRDQKGYYKNDVPGQSLSRLPKLSDYLVRGTLKGDISEALSFRAKVSFGQQTTSGVYSGFQSYYCPTAPAPFDDCKPNGHTRSPDASPVLTASSPLHGKGRPRAHTNSVLASAELDYDLGGATLTSITGYYKFDKIINIPDPTAEPAAFLSSTLQNYRSFTEEVRVASDSSGPLQVLVGAFYQKVDFRNNSVAAFPSPVAPGYGLSDRKLHVDTTAFSVFAQLGYDILPGLNISGGARYSREEKTGTKDITTLAGTTNAFRDLPLNSSNTSPEVTLRYKPDQNLTFYGSYKKGFKSGGYSAVPSVRNTFNPEKVKGFELGFKGELIDRQVRFSTAAYSYEYSDLQVSSVDNVAFTIETLNAARASVKGVEAEIHYSPRAITGLRLGASVGYNKARYKEFRTPCYVGQTIVQGCNLDLVAGVYRSQDVTGKSLLNAPRWAGNASASYETELGGGLNFALGGSATYTGAYQAHDKFNAQGMQSSHWKIDSSVRLFADDRRWEIALIGRNITNVYRATYVQEIVGTGNGTGTATGTSANLGGFYSEPRSIALEATLRY